MKRLLRLLPVFLLLLACLGWTGTPGAIAADLTDSNWRSSPMLVAQAKLRNAADDKLATEFGQKIDLNNAPVRDFMRFRGMFPVLAGKIVDNAPYKQVEDVLKIPGLSDRQIANLKSHLDAFTVTTVSDVYTQGDHRLNDGVYK